MMKMEKVFKKSISRLCGNKREKAVFLAIIFLSAFSFYVGFLTGEKEIAKRAMEELRESEILLKTQKSELDAIREERGVTGTVKTEEDIQKQVSELEELRNKNKEK
jgi:hypothetical protein